MQKWAYNAKIEYWRSEMGTLYCHKLQTDISPRVSDTKSC